MVHRWALNVILASTVAITAVFIFVYMQGIHHVEEGSVGVYWRGGVLLQECSKPGMHVKLPITVFRPVQGMFM